MRYAVNYSKTFRYFDTVDEIIFQYDTSIVDLIQKTIKKPEQKIIINVSAEDIISFEDKITVINKIKKDYPNIMVQISLQQQDQINSLKENDIKFMFVDFAKSKEQIYTMCELGAADIYLVEELCFNLKFLQYYREKYFVNFRVFPDIAQSAIGTNKTIPAITKFFIRPEDIEIYDKYIDVIEFMHTKDRASVAYQVYKQQQWLGNLNDLIYDLKEDIKNTGIAPYFGQERINCQKRCLESRCDLCHQIQSLAEGFDKVGITAIKKRKPIENLTTEEKQDFINSWKEKGNQIYESGSNEKTMRNSTTAIT